MALHHKTPDYVRPITSPLMACQYAQYVRLYRITAQVRKLVGETEAAKTAEACARMYERHIRDYATECELFAEEQAAGALA